MQSLFPIATAVSKTFLLTLLRTILPRFYYVSSCFSSQIKGLLGVRVPTHCFVAQNPLLTTEESIPETSVTWKSWALICYLRSFFLG